MHRSQEFAIDLLVEKQRAHHLDAAAGRPGAGDETGQEQHPQRGKDRPQRVIDTGETGRRRDRNKIEGDMAQRRLEFGVHAVLPDVHRDDKDAPDSDREEPPGLRIVQIGTQRAAADGKEQSTEVHAGNQHEDDGDRFDGRRVEIAEARVVGREAAEAHCRKGMADRVEPLHAGPLVGQHAGHRDADIDKPEAFRRLGDARGHLGILHRPRRLGLEHLPAADAEQRQDRDGQHDQAHAPQPNQLVSPQVDRHRQLVDVGQHRRAGCRQPGNGLEIGIGMADPEMDHQRYRCEGRQHGPHQDNHQEAVADRQFALAVPETVPEQTTAQHGEQERFVVGRLRPIVHDPGKNEWGQHGQPEEHDDHAQRPVNRSETNHGRRLRRSGTRPGTTSRPSSPVSCGYRRR